MLTTLHHNKGWQLLIGLLIGFGFGFLLQKGGLTDYDVIVGQLLLTDFTMIRMMLSAAIVGMLGVYFMRRRGWVQLHPKFGSAGMTVIGGLIFGAGFAILGYCPGTIIGAVGQGSLDALIGGLAGILIGAALFARLYPRIRWSILNTGSFGNPTLPELLGVDGWQLSWVIAAFLFVVLLALGWVAG